MTTDNSKPQDDKAASSSGQTDALANLLAKLNSNPAAAAAMQQALVKTRAELENDKTED